MKNAERISSENEEYQTISLLMDSSYLEELRIQMIKFATLQLQNDSMAEDAVQEALLGAFKNTDSFNRKSAFKTWVFSILKNKIADILRKEKRLPEANQLTKNSEDSDNLNELFNGKGFWQKDERPISWSQPMESIKNHHFWRVFEACLSGLPENQARIFMMREFIELESTEICESLCITTSNLHVMLYRARLRLRECLENRWFSEGEKE